MPPKARARAARVSAADRATAARTAMEALMQTIVERGTLPQRYRTSHAQFVRAPDGRQISLMGIDNKPTKEGAVFYRLLGVEPPKLYDYHQPLINDRWVMSYDSQRIKVRERNDDGTWRITPKGVGYFRYNRVEYLANVPYLRILRGRLVRCDYMPMQIEFNSVRNFSVAFTQF